MLPRCSLGTKAAFEQNALLQADDMQEWLASKKQLVTTNC